MQKYMIGLVALFAPIIVANASSDICSGESVSMAASTPTSQFLKETQDAEVVTDYKTGLMWARCTRGYEWDAVNVSCKSFVAEGDVMKTWSEVLTVASDGVVIAGLTGWRLPNVKELASIVERKCKGVTANKNLFPGTPAAIFWTNTNAVTNSGDANEGAIRVIDFSTGSVTTSARSTPHYLRLVRDAN